MDLLSESGNLRRLSMPPDLHNVDLCEDRIRLEAFRSGDASVLTEIYHRHAPEVSRLIRLGFYVGSTGSKVFGIRDAQSQRELLQEVFMRAFTPRTRMAYDGLRPYRPFLLRIAKNVLVDHGRKHQREVPLSALQTDEHAIDIDRLIEANQPLAEDADAHLDRDPEWLALVRRGEAYVKTLDERAQHFVRLRFEEERTQAEVAEQLHMTRKQVRLLEDKVRGGLKKFIKEMAR